MNKPYENKDLGEKVKLEYKEAVKEKMLFEIKQLQKRSFWKKGYNNFNTILNL